MFQNSRTLDILLERFQCTPLGTKITFCVFSHHFGALQCPFGFAPHTLHLNLVFQVVSRHFVAAPDPLWNQYRVHQIHEFMPLKPFLVLSQRTCPIYYFSLKLKFWMVSRHFFVAPHPLWKLVSGHLKHEFVPRKPILVWSQRPCSIHNFRSKTHVHNSAWYLNALLHSFWQ